MAGFGLYETLRVVLPGTLAVGVFSLMLRLAGGTGPLLDGGPFHSVVKALGGPTFVAVALLVGFLLYLLDLPTRARIHYGDPDNGIQLPTDVLSEMTNGRHFGKRSFSLYFLLSDAALPVEAHKRVYFFGGVYRMYADARYLTAAGMGLGGYLGLAVTSGSGHGSLLLYVFAAFAVLTAVAGTGAVAEFKHASDSMLKISKEQAGRTTSRQAVDGWTLGRMYRDKAVQRVKDLRGVLLMELALGAAACWLCSLAHPAASGVGLILAAAAILLWGMTEMGPPEPPAATRLRVMIRGPLLRRLGAPPAAEAQYVPLQRTLTDIALFAPSLLAAAIAAFRQERPALSVLLWAGFALPATLIMAVRKHEVRLLNSYRDQVLWLELNRAKIEKIAEEGFGEDGWAPS